MKKPIILFSAILIILNSCTTSTSNQDATDKTLEQTEKNPFLEKYAGGYMIGVKGYNSQTDAELYVLHKNGNAKWMMIMVQSNGQTQVVSEKMGTWDASENKIKITIKGNTGDLTEEYSLISGKFVSGDRSLKKTE